jgi:predicted nucleic acid-binding protein
MIVLDTNVISEVMKPRPDPAVLAWFDSQSSEDLWTCMIVVAEILSGLELMPAGKRQIQLREKAEYMFSEFFRGRIFAFNLPAARAYGNVLKARKKAGKPIDEMDALIAATVLASGASLATRNTSHFESSGNSSCEPVEGMSRLRWLLDGRGSFSCLYRRARRGPPSERNARYNRSGAGHLRIR